MTREGTESRLAPSAGLWGLQIIAASVGVALAILSHREPLWLRGLVACMFVAPPLALALRLPFRPRLEGTSIRTSWPRRRVEIQSIQSISIPRPWKGRAKIITDDGSELELYLSWTLTHGPILLRRLLASAPYEADAATTRLDFQGAYASYPGLRLVALLAGAVGGLLVRSLLGIEAPFVLGLVGGIAFFTFMVLLGFYHLLPPRAWKVIGR